MPGAFSLGRRSSPLCVDGYTQTRPEAELAERFELILPFEALDIRPRYNLATNSG